MKRWISLVLAVFLVLAPGLALGTQSPLQEISYNRVAYPDGTAIELVSYYAALTVRGSTSINASLTMQNTGDADEEIYIGTPYPMDDGYQVDKPQAWCEGEKLPLKRLKRTADAGEGIPEHWYGWKMDFMPGQTRVLTISFTTDTKIEPDGTRCVVFPLHYLRHFKGAPQYVQITADMDYYPPYVYDPAPSPYPQTLDSGGSLIWSFTQGEMPDQIELKFKPTIPVIERYLEQDGDPDIGQILSLFEKSQYREAVDSIDTYINNHEDYVHKNALLTLKSLCLEKLMRLDDALDLLSYLAHDPGFGDMNPSFQNRIIFETAWIMSAQGKNDAQILDYLTVQQPLVDPDSMFGRWLDAEIWRLTPRPTPTPAPTPVPVAAPTHEPGREDWFGSLVDKKVSMGSLDIPLLYLIGGGLLIVVIVVLIVVVRTGRSRRGRYHYR